MQLSYLSAHEGPGKNSRERGATGRSTVLRRTGVEGISQLTRQRGGRFNSAFPDSFEQAHPVSVKDGGDIIRRVASVPEKRIELLQIGDRVKILRALLRTEAAIEIAADGHMSRVPGQLANVIDVAHNIREDNTRIYLSPNLPTRNNHPGIECGADHAVPLNHSTNLIIRELAAIRRDTSTVVVARENWSGE